MKTSISRGFWVAAALLAGYGLARISLDAKAQSDEILGKRAPDFQLQAVDGGRVKLSTYRGKVVVLDFWAVWCGPCQESMPFFQKLQDQYGAKGLEVIGLHVDDRMPPLPEVKQYLAERSIHYRNLVSNAEVDDGFKIYAMPTTYILDREGVLRKRHVGYNPATAPQKLEKDIRELLGLN